MDGLFSGVCPASRRCGKLCIALLAILCPSLALAAPQGGRVTHGTASISQQGSTTTINQSSNKASINWNSFSINPRETVNFNQPGRNAVTLNRVVGNEKSVIQGALNANGKVFLINSNGVLFTRGATVNTAGFVASMLDISDQDFEQGRYHFQGSGSGGGEIINMGTIRVEDGGYAALLGEKVSNQGVIVADKGSVVLAGGKRVTLNFNGDSLINVSLDEGALDALVENKQAIRADGGKVILTARAADDLVSAQVNTSGVIRARSLADLKGEILIDAKGGTARIDGVLDASAPVSGDGGFIETSGDRVVIADSAKITAKAKNGRAGTWLIDPVDFTVGQDGDISGAKLSENLGNQNVVIESTKGKNKNGKGDINVNEKVAWNADTSLTLTAENDININASITATGERAGLAMNFGGDYNILTRATYSGAVLDENGKPVANKAPEGTEYAAITLAGKDATLAINGNEYTLIHSMADLDKINQANGAGYFALANDLDAGGVIYDDSLILKLGEYYEDLDFETWEVTYVPVSQGVLAGLGHSIDKLAIHATGKDNIALIGEINTSSVVRDLGLTNVDIRSEALQTEWGASGGRNAGALYAAGRWDGLISQVFVTGNVSGRSSVGGLGGSTTSMGETSYAVVRKSFSDASVTMSPASEWDMGIGGLIAGGSRLHVYSSHATGEVRGGSSLIGGLVGYLSGYLNPGNYHELGSTIQNSYASGKVTGDAGSSEVGGLIGRYDSGSRYMVFSNNFATGDVIGGHKVGGLAGEFINSDFRGIYELLTEPMLAVNLYASGNVTSILQERNNGQYGLGGLIGNLGSGIVLRDSQASGTVRADGPITSLGGLIGMNSPGSFLNNCLANGDVSGPNGTGDPNGGLGGLIGTNFGTIENSLAYGNIKAGTGFAGGLAGENRGTIRDSYAYGNAEGEIAGGLVGANNYQPPTQGERSPVISGSGAYGNAHSIGTFVGDTHTSAAGGLAGMNSGNISDSFAMGAATGGVQNAGLVGNNTTLTIIGDGSDTPHGQIDNSYWNSELNSNGANHFDNNQQGEPGMSNSQGLTGEQMNDVNHYIDGTIDQVLAERAAQRAAEEAARQEAIAREVAELTDIALKLGSGQEHSAARSSGETPPLEEAGSLSAMPVPIEDFIVNNAVRAFSANIKSMEVDGVRYNLEEEETAD